MGDFDASLSERERTFFRALNDLGVRYLLVGMSAALLQGARGATEHLDLWFESLSDPRLSEAARRAGGFFVSRSEPPMLAVMSDRLNVIVSMSGLPDVASEYANAKVFEVDGVSLHVLPLERIIASKRAANRAKDRSVIEGLELAHQVLKREKGE
jgi:hypothetical protein